MKRERKKVTENAADKKKAGQETPEGLSPRPLKVALA
jgi:hypothetical protein